VHLIILMHLDLFLSLIPSHFISSHSISSHLISSYFISFYATLPTTSTGIWGPDTPFPGQYEVGDVYAGKAEVSLQPFEQFHKAMEVLCGSFALLLL
jgi:hypothetical protein